MHLSPLRLRVLIGSLLTVSFLGALDHTVVSTSLATIAGDLGALEQMAWVVVGFTLASTVLLPVLGKLGDMVGPRRVFLIALAVFVAASLACGFAQDLPQLVIARVVQGMSSAGLQLMSQTIVAYVAPPRQRPRLLAVIGTAFPVAIVVGPLLGGVITDHWGWPWVFWINVPVGLAALLLASFAVPHVVPSARPRIDAAGAVVFTVAMTALVLGVTELADPRSVVAASVLLGVAALALALFVVIELRASAPIFPIRALAGRTLACAIALSVIIGIGLFSVVAYLPTYVQLAYGTTATVSGIVPVATVFGMLVANLVTGARASRTGRYRAAPLVGTSLGAAGMLTMGMLPAGLPLWVPAVVMFVVGLGAGCYMSLLLAIAQSAAPRHELGAVTAATNLMRQIGATVATAVIGGVVGFGLAAAVPAGVDATTLTPELVRRLSPALRTEVAGVAHDVFAAVFLCLAAVQVVGILVALLLPAGTLADRAEPDPVPASPAPPTRPTAASHPLPVSKERT